MPERKVKLQGIVPHSRAAFSLALMITAEICRLDTRLALEESLSCSDIGATERRSLW